MTYHFEPDRSLEEGMRTVASDQIDKALKAIEQARDARENGIHDLRKRMKKLRGLLRLLRPGLGSDYAPLNKEFRDIARMFSEVRDAHVLSETVEALADGAAESSDHLASVLDWAEERRAAAMGACAIDDRLDEARDRLERARKGLDHWCVEAPVEGLAGGLKKTYGRARDRYQEACRTAEPGVLHDWRKRVKYHWYHVRLLNRAWPAAMKARADALDNLSDALGLDHDTVVLLETVAAEGGDLPQPAREHLHAVATARRQALLATAMIDGARLFSEKPKALARRISASWAAAVAEA